MGLAFPCLLPRLLLFLAYLNTKNKTKLASLASLAFLAGEVRLCIISFLNKKIRHKMQG